jgi:archaellum component FlaD/FlaE
MAAESGKTKTTSAANEEQRSPEEIQADIESTREDMGDTVAELADKADVKKQAKKKVDATKAKAAAKKDEVAGKVASQKDAVAEKVKETAPESAQEGAQQAAAGTQQFAAQTTQKARENPMQTAVIAAFVGGVVLGWTLGRR